MRTLSGITPYPLFNRYSIFGSIKPGNPARCYQTERDRAERGAQRRSEDGRRVGRKKLYVPVTRKVSPISWTF